MPVTKALELIMECIACKNTTGLRIGIEEKAICVNCIGNLTFSILKRSFREEIEPSGKIAQCDICVKENRIYHLHFKGIHICELCFVEAFKSLALQSVLKIEDGVELNGKKTGRSYFVE